MPPKKISSRDITGERGVALVRKMILDMGFMFYETGGVEAGIDGIIEIRDSETEEATNLIIQAQVKSTQREWEAETGAGFVYRCKENDLDYWLQGNAPVILIVAKPDTNEAYWISIKDYFNSPEKIESKKIVFDKQANQLVGARDAFVHLAVPKDSGIYFSPTRTEEKLISNLLEVASFAESIFSAETKFRQGRQIWRRAMELNIHLPGEWILWNNRIWSFHDLSEDPWCEICDPVSLDEFDTEDWAFSSDQDDRTHFRWLLQCSVKEILKKWEFDMTRIWSISILGAMDAISHKK